MTQEEQDLINFGSRNELRDLADRAVKERDETLGYALRLKDRLDEARAAYAKANDLWQGVMDALALADAEIAYLRRQIALDDNWQDPEFGGCTPDPEKPPHLKGAGNGQRDVGGGGE